ncbi:alanine or glycine:cation symporter, AGCS family [Kytococcus aerolatus]|uniref:Alanine or glycine:cation symporter, AGCS family n=1 Tax=Kytococcus aerolatus TaxID=592308 RepID=A0A212U602_9MICO|nr:amino acid carrier protein [Kytococcus aerolatus]SNC73514.1 alanine or glycine:cation symporter, AGCS family [Kytococcus aerolatus]
MMLTEAEKSGVDATMERVFGPFVEWLSGIVFATFPLGGTEMPYLIVWLLLSGTVLSLLIGPQILYGLRQVPGIIRGLYNRKDDPGEITSYQALATELSGTVGLGNVAGVAVAITVGGPGATLWMILAGLLGMSIKAAEATLGAKYRLINEDGSVSGGPMYYLKHGLAERGMGTLGLVLAGLYAVSMTIGALGAGNVFQANQVAVQLTNLTGGQDSFLAGRAWIVGVVLAALAAIVIFGGIRSIAQWTSRLTPIMAILYVACVLVILAANAGALPGALSDIWTGAFTGEGVEGGVIGVAIVGVQRALFSNAAGVGSAGVAHSPVRTRRPAQEGLVASLEPFIDSVVICTLTALAIIVTGQHAVEGAEDGVALTSAAFGTVHAVFPWLLTLIVLLLGFSTVLSYSYYGKKAAGYLFGNSRAVELIYDVFWIVMIVVGAAVSLDTVVGFSDSMFFLLTLPNLLGLYLLSGVLRRELSDHTRAYARGEMEVVPQAERSIPSRVTQTL